MKTLEEITNNLYTINAYISLNYIGMNQKPTKEDLRDINREISNIIRDLRHLDGYEKFLKQNLM